jgi:hypothetical protein
MTFRNRAALAPQLLSYAAMHRQHPNPVADAASPAIAPRLAFYQFKARWRRFASAPPGERFRSLYAERARSVGNTVRKVLVLAAGDALMAVGLLLMPAPGPGTVVFVLGAALAAQESLAAARLLDAAEVRLRRLAEVAARRWFEAPFYARAALVAAAVLLAALAGYAAYRWFFA